MLCELYCLDKNCDGYMEIWTWFEVYEYAQCPECSQIYYVDGAESYDQETEECDTFFWLEKEF